MSVDEHFSLTTRIARPAAEVFAWHERPGALARLCPPWERIEIVSSVGGVREGARVTVRNKFGPCWIEWRVEHRDYEAGRQFRDVQLSGPFARWEHLHRIVPDGAGACWLTDDIGYRLPGGRLGRIAAGALVRRKLEKLFAWRHEITKHDLESSAATFSEPRHVIIAGASGLLGRSLAPFLETQGHRVSRLVRRPARSAEEVSWNPARGELDAGALEGVDAIINLSGENVGGGRWTNVRREAIFKSRVDATRTLVDAMKRMLRKPEVLVSASAVGIYGDRGDESLTERSELGAGFLPDVCRAWESEAARAREIGVRTVILRLGVVLTPAGGVLAKLLPVFKAGLGGLLGGGHQWMSWIAIDDAVNAIHQAIMASSWDGSWNVVSPEPVTNREFTLALALVLRRPARLAVPAWTLRALLGEMADGTILASGRVYPERLKAAGFDFRQSSLDAALRNVLGR